MPPGGNTASPVIESTVRLDRQGDGADGMPRRVQDLHPDVVEFQDIAVVQQPVHGDRAADEGLEARNGPLAGLEVHVLGPGAFRRVGRHGSSRWPAGWPEPPRCGPGACGSGAAG